MKTAWLLLLVTLQACTCNHPVAPAPAPAEPEASVVVTGGTSVTIRNPSPDNVTVAVAFGSDSKVLPANWAFCTASGPLTCSFPLDGKKNRVLPLEGAYLNATFAFGSAVGCGSTKAEVNANNPTWYNVVDISLVDGFSTPLTIAYKDPSGARTFSVSQKAGNEKAPAVYPLGCDTCVARTKPACGMSPGKDGCKGGTQFKPDVPCQYQGSTMGGQSTSIEIVLGAPM